MKKIPMRTCVVCHESLPKSELLRIVKTPTGEIKVDMTGKINGHGAYLKKDEKVLELAKSKKVLEKVLETSIDDSVYQEIERLIHG
ncbi:MAG: YlxR family protein [Erysipelotrichaceae bacterium]|nr:YlxR family protein [Erysipelotrichaceae bacterium]